MHALKFQIHGVVEEVIDGRPQLILDVTDEHGDRWGIILERDVAAELTKLLGPHPLVEAFFRGGRGLQ